MQVKERPTGVTILAVLYFLGTAFFVMAGVAMIAGMGIAGASSDQAGMGAMLAGLGVMGAILLFCCAAIQGLLGWGMWKLKGWARLIVLIFAFIGLAFGALGMLGSLLSMDLTSIVMGTLPVAINGLIAWYLLQPHVKQAFA
jgi:hypothetical protein